MIKQVIIENTVTNKQVVIQTNAFSSSLGNLVQKSRTLSINGVSYDLSQNRSWTVNDETAVGSLQQVTTLGATATNNITITDDFDAIKIEGNRIHVVGNPNRGVTTNNFEWLRVDALQAGQDQVPFVFNRRSAANPPNARNNEIMTFGFNLDGGGNLLIGGLAGLGESWESGYTSGRWQEKHEFYVTPEGIQKRLSSYTVKGPTDIDFYHTTSNFYIKSASDVTYIPYAISWGSGAGNVAGNVNFTLNAGAGTTYNWYYDNQGIQLTAVGALKNFYMDQMTSVILPGMTSYKAGGSLYNQTGHMLPYLGQDAVFSLGLTDTRYLNAFIYTLDAHTIKVTDFAGVGDRPVGVDANGTFKIITAGGEQVNSDWNAVSGAAQILNKPTIPSQYTAENAQDDVGGILSSEFTYADGTPLISVNAIAQSKITGLVSALALKADLVSGIVPTSQLPASIVAIETYADFASLPGTGASNTIYITSNNNKRYLWASTQYIEIGATPPVLSVNTQTGDVVLTASSVGAAPSIRNITINGTTFDLSADRTWNVGTVTGNSVTSANGFAGTFTSTATPALTITTTITGILYGNGTSVAAAIAANFPTLNQSTTGTADNVSGTVALDHGGTGQVTASASFNALSPATTLGDLIYGSGTNTNARLAGNTTTTKKFLVQTGGGSVSAAPVWDTITTFDVPTLNQNTTGTASNITGVLTGASFPALTGDVTTTIGNLATTIANNVVTIAKFQTVSTGTILGRNTASTGNIEVLTVLPTAVMPAFTGDVTNSAGSLALTIGNGIVTLAKMADMATASFIGRNTASTGVPEVLSMSTSRTMLSINNVENTALTTWAGSTSLITLGTVSTGTWSATTIAVNKGGTGQTTAAAAFNGLNPMSATGDIIYASSSTVASRLGGNTAATNQFLKSTGTGSAAQAPSWYTLIAGDIPNIAESQVTNLTTDLSAKEATANKDATGGYAGLTLFKINFKNAANTFTSLFTNTNTAARTYTFQNRDGTISDDTDLALKANLAGPTFTGVPAAPTAAVDTNTTQLATTAYVIGQAYAKLAGPTFTGTPAAPTAAVDTNTTQIATTAYVIGQAYAKLASPTFTGTPTLPTGTIAVTQSAADSSTKVATTAFVTTADNLKANLASPTFTGTPTLPTGTIAVTQAAGDSTTAIATTAYVQAAIERKSYKTILIASNSHTAAIVAGTYAMSFGNVQAVSGTGTLYPLALIHLATADYPTVDGVTTKLRVKATVNVNDVAPTGNFTFGLYPVTRPGTSGGAGVDIFTLGTVIVGSTVLFTTPAADSQAQASSTDFAFPSDGFYVLGYITTATTATSSHLHLHAQLQYRNN